VSSFLIFLSSLRGSVYSQRMDQITLKRYVRYDEETGEFFWLPRTPDMFVDSALHSKDAYCAMWNTRFSGKKAGSQHKAGYYRLVINGQRILMHRAVWMYHHGECPRGELDHKDRNPSNNRIENLREASRSQNEANKRSNKSSASGLQGVTWHKIHRKWHARIRFERKTFSLGLFSSKADAHAAYVKAAIAHYGEFSSFN